MNDSRALCPQLLLLVLLLLLRSHSAAAAVGVYNHIAFVVGGCDVGVHYIVTFVSVGTSRRGQCARARAHNIIMQFKFHCTIISRAMCSSSSSSVLHACMNTGNFIEFQFAAHLPSGVAMEGETVVFLVSAAAERCWLRVPWDTRVPYRIHTRLTGRGRAMCSLRYLMEN